MLACKELCVPVIHFLLIGLYADAAPAVRVLVRCQARVRALYVGNVEIWQEQVMRITLFNRPPIPVIAWLATLARMLCGCCLSPTRPLFVYRISLFWGITVKHLLPSATIYLVVQGELISCLSLLACFEAPLCQQGRRPHQNSG